MSISPMWFCLLNITNFSFSDWIGVEGVLLLTVKQ